jgi:hypothetical protein
MRLISPRSLMKPTGLRAVEVQANAASGSGPASVWTAGAGSARRLPATGRPGEGPLRAPPRRPGKSRQPPSVGPPQAFGPPANVLTRSTASTRSASEPRMAGMK